jgi:hypothetical protein
VKHPRWSKCGQFIIIAALIIATFTLTLVLSISQISLTRQELSYEPVQELVLGLASDFDRCLTRALSIATHRYNETGSLEKAKAAGDSFIMKWVNSTLISYSNLGLQIVINATGEGGTDIAWIIDWSSSTGISYVYTRFNLNIEAYGFRGWASRSMKIVWLNITDWNINISTSPATVTLEFQLMQSKREAFEPILGLAPENVQVEVDTIQANVTDLTYLGSGIYRVKFEADSIGVKIILTITTPEDFILVSACTDTEWEAIYLSREGKGLGKEIILAPISRLQSENGFATPVESHGREVLEVNSIPTTKNITLGDRIQVKLFLDQSKSRPGNINITVEFGFKYGDETHWLGSDTERFIGEKAYIFEIPAGDGEIPEGSILILKVTVTSDKGFGSIRILYGPNYPSQIVLRTP